MLTKLLAEITADALALVTLPGTLETAALTLGAILPIWPRKVSSVTNHAARVRRLAVVIPARNESSTIMRCLNSLRTCNPPGQSCEARIVVVADNCTDDTEELARASGAIIIVRTDAARLGKGFALQDAFEQLLPQGYDAFLIVDADSVVEANLLSEVATVLASGADAVQVKYLALNGDASFYTRLTSLGLKAFNVLRPRSRDRLGLSAGILGNGFALPRETLLSVPYSTSSIVEDLEYHLRLVRAGKKVAFTVRTAVSADMPIGWSAAARQRSRWEGGRLRMLRENALPLARELLEGNLTVLEPLLELLTLPMSFQIALLAVVFALGTIPLKMFTLVSGAIVAAYFTTAVLIADGDVWDLAILPAVPFYIGWKLMLSINIFTFSRKDAKWLRTPRPRVTSEL